jgi:hypothetical protein
MQIYYTVQTLLTYSVSHIILILELHIMFQTLLHITSDLCDMVAAFLK